MLIGNTLIIVGLFLDLIAAYILLKNVFITDGEIKQLSDLPIEESTSHMTGRESGDTKPIALTDVKELADYKDRFIKERNIEKKRGQTALRILIFGFILQIVGQLWLSL